MLACKASVHPYARVPIDGTEAQVRLKPPAQGSVLKGCLGPVRRDLDAPLIPSCSPVLLGTEVGQAALLGKGHDDLEAEGILYGGWSNAVASAPRTC